LHFCQVDNSDLGFDENTVTEVASQWGASIPFMSSYSLDLDGDRWDSWEDFHGPNEINGGEFTNVARYNLSSPVIRLAFGGDIAGYGSNQIDYDQPWDADDIILLQDGFCASTCAIFTELMKTDGGVKSVVTGGIPQYRPASRWATTLTGPGSRLASSWATASSAAPTGASATCGGGTSPRCGQLGTPGRRPPAAPGTMPGTLSVTGSRTGPGTARTTLSAR
jgi:hypothetical protein